MYRYLNTFLTYNIPDSKNVNLTLIVLEVGNPTLLKDSREVRALKVADATACINMSLWDEPGKLLMPGDIVRMTKGYASIWRTCLKLYAGKNGNLDKIGEFCMVFYEQINMSEPNPCLMGGSGGSSGPQRREWGWGEAAPSIVNPTSAPAATVALQQPTNNQSSAGKNSGSRYSNEPGAGCDKAC
ncbi:SOSS complex subunit B homolog [Nilaparvata lugens]|uniref:SOSS complex subunit B homolog n=1 Tax=Nilaparvata lugens TaxID=108931 RepID=UPI00193D3A6D|nr:SOSS complex subunit B homolog [Nilaparvata lugens]